MRRYALGEPRWSWGEPALTPPAALFCRINFLCHFFPGLFVHFDLHDLSAPRVSTSRKTPPEISKNTTTNCQTRSDCLILLIARSPFNVLSGITVACSSCRGPLPSGSGRPAISFPLLTSWQLMHYSWAPSTFWPRAASLWPTAARQFSSGHCTTHTGAVRHKKTLGDYTLCLDRSACQCRSAPRAPKQRYRALHRAEQPSVLRGMLWTYGHSDLRMSFSHQATANSATTTSKYVLNLTCPLAILLFCPSPFPFSWNIRLDKIIKANISGKRKRTGAEYHSLTRIPITIIA